MYINASVARVNNMSTSLALETSKLSSHLNRNMLNYLSFQYIDHMVQTVRFWFTWGEGMD